jgi:hypothetical protein
VNETPKKDILILMGDWNSTIGMREEPGTIGRYGLGNRNEARQRLLEFCEENDPFLASTYFEQPERRFYNGRHRIASIETKLTIYLAEDDGEALFSQ